MDCLWTMLWTIYGLDCGLFFHEIVVCESSQVDITLLSFQNQRNFQGVHIFWGSPRGWMYGLQSTLWTSAWTVSKETFISMP